MAAGDKMRGRARAATGPGPGQSRLPGHDYGCAAHLCAETDFLLGAVRQLIRGATAFGGLGRQADLRQLPSVRLSAAATRSSKSALV